MCNTHMKVSVVIPVFNEEGNVTPLAEELDAVRGALPELEAVFVDDGSSDGTWARIEDCRARFPFVRGIRCPGNRGQSSATLIGLRAAAGDVLVTMDGDRQNNPGDIPKLIERIGTCDVVCGYRTKRRDSWSRRAGSRIGNTVRNWVTHDGIRDTGCSLKAFRRECIADLPPLNGMHRFMPAYFKLNGRTIEQVPVDHRPRTHGRSKYTNLRRLPRTLFDLFGFLWYRRRYLRTDAAP
jgi:dolichol-phosphate mannosyltransferase